MNRALHDPRVRAFLHFVPHLGLTLVSALADNFCVFLSTFSGDISRWNPPSWKVLDKDQSARALSSVSRMYQYLWSVPPSWKNENLACLHCRPLDKFWLKLWKHKLTPSEAKYHRHSCLCCYRTHLNCRTERAWDFQLVFPLGEMTLWQVAGGCRGVARQTQKSSRVPALDQMRDGESRS